MFKKTLANEITKKVCVYIPKKSYCIVVKPLVNFIIDGIHKGIKRHYYSAKIKDTYNPFKKLLYYCKMENISCNSYTVSSIAKLISSILFVIGMLLLIFLKLL